MSPERRTSKLDPNAFSDVNEVILASTPAGKLYDIWYKFGLTSRTPEDAANRRKELANWSASLTKDDEKLLETIIKHAGEERLTQDVGWGYFVKQKAEQDAEKELYRKKEAAKQTEQQPKASRGEKLHVRRQKAQARRGTDPKSIR